jgi:hypothetical protein
VLFNQQYFYPSRRNSSIKKTPGKKHSESLRDSKIAIFSLALSLSLENKQLSWLSPHYTNQGELCNNLHSLELSSYLSIQDHKYHKEKRFCLHFFSVTKEQHFPKNDYY